MGVSEPSERPLGTEEVEKIMNLHESYSASGIKVENLPKFDNLSNYEVDDGVVQLWKAEIKRLVDLVDNNL